MTAEQTAEKIKNILTDKKAIDVEIIDIEGKTILADRFIVATGTSVTHIKSLADEIEVKMKNEHQVTPDHIEGYASGRWILMDYADVVVHIFHTDERSFYNLEKLWQSSRVKV